MLDSLTGEKGNDTKAVVRAACGPLLEILEDETVSVIHHSFTEFLTDSSRDKRQAPGSVHPQFPVIGLPTTHRILALTCLRYLTSGCLSGWEVVPRKKNSNFYNHPVSKQQGIKMQHPFLDYAVGNVAFHIRQIRGIDANLCSKLDEFMQQDNHDFQAFLDLAWQGARLSETTPIHVAAWAGLTDYARHLVEKGQGINAPDAQKRTLLSWASGRGHADFVAFLLEQGAETDTDDSMGLKPLHYAARANHYAIVKMLLAAGVSPLTPKTREYPGRRCGNAPTTTGETPLLYACQSGNAESVQEMMPYLKAEDLNRSLCIASQNGKTQVVDLLLTSPEVLADPPDASDTPLFLASAGLHVDIMRSLLKKGADPMRRSKNYSHRAQFFSISIEDLGKKQEPGPTPFHALCGASQNHVSNDAKDEELLRKSFHILSEAGCDVNAIDDKGKTPLHYSVAQGSYGRANNVLSALLLEAGADAMKTDKEGNTPLHLLQLYKDSAPTVEALIAHGADVNARRHRDGKTPIHTAVESNHGLDLKVMLPYVKNWSVKDSDGNTPLHIILSKSYDPDKVVGDLLDAGADLTARNKKGEVPLHVARELRNSGKNVLPLLLKAGVDLEARDHEGRTTLLRTVMGVGGSRDSAAAEVLLKNGAKIDTRDYDGNGILHAVCRKSADVKFLRMLLDAGADPLTVNHKGNNLLHELAINYKAHGEDNLGDTLRLLLRNGLSPTARNNAEETVLHAVFGSLPPQILNDKKNPLDLFLTSQFLPLINAADNNGVRPLHLAAVISEELVAKLLVLGADPIATTNEERTILHAAARARQSNTLGLVLDHLTTIHRLDLADQQDSHGRTALHDACRSGRPESVALLLKAGANPNARDNSQYTPLHACAEFEEENKLWAPDGTNVHRLEMRSRGVLLSDNKRPIAHDGFHQQQRGRTGMWTQIAIESDTVRVRDIIRLLAVHGADMDAICQGQSFAIDLALSNGCEEMVRELLPYFEKAYAKVIEEKRSWDWCGHRSRSTFHEEYLSLRSKHLPSILEKEMKREGNQKINRCFELLALREFDALQRLPEMGLDFTPRSKEGSCDFLGKLVNWGYTELVETIGASVKGPWVNGLLNTGDEKHYSWTQYAIEPYLLTALRSRLPNLEIVKLLVEKFGADVNIQPLARTYRGNRQTHEPSATALHMASCGTTWWQVEAVKYLLSKGANPEIRNEKGQTALHVAVSNDHNYGAYLQRQTTQVLLEHGADPNAMDQHGLTCLNKAIHDVALVGLLIKYGADITLGEKPVLFSAIIARDLPTIKTLLGTGADCNKRQMEKPKMGGKLANLPNIDQVQEHEYYPVHFAASHKFDNIHERDTAIQIVNFLLENGADPLLQFREDACILHHILGHGGVLRPFLEMPMLDLERRDPKGRTLLLAACSSSRGTGSPSNFNTTGWNATPWEERKKALTKDDPTAAQTLLEMGADFMAVDNEGNNGLHLLILASPHNDEEYKKTFELFVKNGPDLVTQKNRKGYTPYHYAVQKQRMWTARELVRAGADPLEQEPEGNTALHYLASTICSSGLGLAPSFKEFLDLGISVNTANNKGETPLFNYFATPSYFGSSGQARKHFGPFDEADADIFATNNEGETLLHVVAKRVYGNFVMRRENTDDVLDAFKFLMEKGLDPMKEDRNQRSTLDVAAACGNQEILDLFKRDAGSVAKTDKVLGKDDSGDDW